MGSSPQLSDLTQSGSLGNNQSPSQGSSLTLPSLGESSSNFRNRLLNDLTATPSIASTTPGNTFHIPQPQRYQSFLTGPGSVMPSGVPVFASGLQSGVPGNASSNNFFTASQPGQSSYIPPSSAVQSPQPQANTNATALANALKGGNIGNI